MIKKGSFIKFITLIFINFILISNISSSLTMFSISPNYNSGAFILGSKIKSGNAIPYIGVQFYKLDLIFTQEGFIKNDKTNSVYKNIKEIPANVYFPQIGLKIFVQNKDMLNFYVNSNVGYGLISTIKNQNNICDCDLNSVFNNVDLFNIDLGVGGEYFVSTKFSIGGEINFHYLFEESRYMKYGNVINSKTNKVEELDIYSTINLNQGIINTRLFLNYYFGK